MTVTSVHKDADALTMTITTEFQAPADRVWQVWADPRQLERWWGPPTYPATVVDHDLVPGGSVSYFMTGPEGDEHHGWWKVSTVDAPHRLEFTDGFADSDGRPDSSMPVTTTQVAIEEAADGRTHMAITTRFPSADAMAQLTAMGMDEGMSLALGQIDDILASESV